MEIQILDNGNTQFKIYNESHTLLNPLVDLLLKKDNVVFASYKYVHPLKNESILNIRLNEKDRGKEIAVIMETIDEFKTELIDMKMKIDQTF